MMSVECGCLRMFDDFLGCMNMSENVLGCLRMSENINFIKGYLRKSDISRDR